MAYETRPLEDLEKVCRELESASSRLRQVVADVRREELSVVKLQWNLVENFVIPKLQDWTLNVNTAVQKFIRNQRNEAAGASFAAKQEALSSRSRKKREGSS